jgi:riboflavin kinase/FMN adenylyltransferase
VGTFDGVHRGHWAVLERLDRTAVETGLSSLLITFEPHPLEIVRPDIAPKLLTTVDEKKEVLSLSRIDYVALLAFTDSLSRYLPEEFVREILIERFRLRQLVVGYDHGFGRDRRGDPETLKEIGARYGFGVEVVGPVLLHGEPISSTLIREAVAAGEVERARAALGRPYSLTGLVIHGEGRGHGLGFPTANLQVEDARKLLPRDGVYAVRAAAAGHLGNGLLHLGPRPTFRGSPPSVELHLLDFDGDLYDERVRVEVLRRLRDVRPFDSPDRLVEQMKRDRAAALDYFDRE